MSEWRSRVCQTSERSKTFDMSSESHHPPLLIQTTESSNVQPIQIPFQISAIEDAVNAQMTELSKDNTQKAYGNKGKEFLQFCRELYAREGDMATMVSEEKLYLFLYYQAHRKKRKQGARVAATFNLADYQQVMGQPTDSITLASDVVGYDCVNQYYSAVLKVLESQERYNHLRKVDIRSSRVVRLLTLAKNRRQVLKKKQYAEKIEASFFGYTQVQVIPTVEEALFKKHSNSLLYMQAAFRDRFCFLMTMCGILRGESLFLCELSDLLDVQYENPGNV